MKSIKIILIVIMLSVSLCCIQGCGLVWLYDQMQPNISEDTTDNRSSSNDDSQIKKPLRYTDDGTKFIFDYDFDKDGEGAYPVEIVYGKGNCELDSMKVRVKHKSSSDFSKPHYLQFEGVGKDIWMWDNKNNQDLIHLTTLYYENGCTINVVFHPTSNVAETLVWDNATATFTLNIVAYNSGVDVFDITTSNVNIGKDIYIDFVIKNRYFQEVSRTRYNLREMAELYAAENN